MYKRTLFVLALLVLGVACTTEDELQELLMRYLYPAESPTQEERHVDEPEARSLSGKVESLMTRKGKVSCRKSLPKEKICDFVGDCPDWKDEKNCEKKYRKKGGCQALIFLKDCDFCDGFTDCADNSDEENCPAGTPTCLEVIPIEWICDGWRHCYDWSDETNCEQGGNNGGGEETNNGGEETNNNGGDDGGEEANNGGGEEANNGVDEGTNVGGETQKCINPSANRTDNKDFGDFMDQVLDAHNYYRCLHNVAPLEIVTDLIIHGQQVSDNNAYYRRLQHSSDSDYGENLWYRGRSGDFRLESITGLEVVKAWYDEIADYDFSNPGFSGKTGHFTQVVWKATTHVGCGYSLSQTDYYGLTSVYVACNYYPRGNSGNPSQYTENVLPEGNNGGGEETSNGGDEQTNSGGGGEDTNNDVEIQECINPSGYQIDNGGMNDFMKQVIDAHNYYRCMHNVGPLVESSVLNKHAQSLSENNSISLSLQHSNSEFGENLWYIGRSGDFDKKSITGLDVVKAWYDEIKDYNFDYPGFSGKTGHFTQVVWKDTTEIGCGYSQVKRDRYTYVFVACNYDPPGNILSEFLDNVLPKKSVAAKMLSQRKMSDDFVTWITGGDDHQ